MSLLLTAKKELWCVKRLQQFGQIRLLHMSYKKNYKQCFQILGVPSTADQNTVRRAYIDLVKRVHPDSGQPEASEERFHIIDEAFRKLQEKFAKNRRGISESNNKTVPDIKHTAPQHRQYLNFDGFGIGNPSQREKQYKQIKVIKAQENVLNHRLAKSQAGETNLIKKNDYFEEHAIKTKFGIDRVVEDLIQESISKGDFKNLKGAGKPLYSARDLNPYLDFTTHKLNKILLDNGFTPDWITLLREIRNNVKELKSKITKERSFFGDYPFLLESDGLEWEKFLKNLEKEVTAINKQIDKYNLIVPIAQNQLFRIDIEKMSTEILLDPRLPKNFTRCSKTEVDKNNAESSSGFLSFFNAFL